MSLALLHISAKHAYGYLRLKRNCSAFPPFLSGNKDNAMYKNNSMGLKENNQ